MPTSSITKMFVISDDETCEKIIEAMNQPRTTKPVQTDSYENGKAKMKLFFMDSSPSVFRGEISKDGGADAE